MKKALSILLVAALMTASLAGMAMANTEAYYLSVTGTIISIEELEEGLRVEIAMPAVDRDARAFLNITENTVFPFDTQLSEGDTVTAYYLANAPMIAIYPPQYTVAVLVSGTPESQNVVVDRFNPIEGQDGRFLAQGGNLIINIGEDTEVVLADGEDFNFEYGTLDGRRMVVIYAVETRSMPPMTTPLKVIVLFEDIAFGPLPIDPGMVPSVDGDTPWQTLPHPLDPSQHAVTLPYGIFLADMPIIVNGEEISAPAAVQTDDAIMVPIRAVAEALGYEVYWDAEQYGVRLGVAINIWIGNSEVHIARMAPQTISAAPVLINGFTYVPLDFFRLIGVNNVHVFEAQIVFDNINEPME